MKNAEHWADNIARALQQRHDEVVCAAGISPSGTVHIGNFREIITVDIIFRALHDRSVSARFLYFWDDYDALRAVPQNVNQEGWEDNLRKPLADVPDPHGQQSSYARHNERAVEEVLPLLGICPEYIYQSEQYRRHTYAEMIRVALQKRDAIRMILNMHRHKPLDENWWPVTIYSTFTGKDTTAITDWDGAWVLRYRCLESEKCESLDVRTASSVKLRWRVDWPMRWAYNAINFEPAGKDHHTEGGSYDTAKEIARQVFGVAAPMSIQYDFIRIKGGSGKMSSSTGEMLSIGEVLEVYQPEVLRYLFASTRTNVEFAISFDIDVIKLYEDYDRCERIAYGAEEVGKERRAKERRIYELSQCSVSNEDMDRADDGADDTPRADTDNMRADTVNMRADTVNMRADTALADTVNMRADTARADTTRADAENAYLNTDNSHANTPHTNTSHANTSHANTSHATVASLDSTIPFQIPFRHLCNLLQIYEGNIERVVELCVEDRVILYKRREYIRMRAQCAWNWIIKHAPESFRFTLTDPARPLLHLNKTEWAICQQIATLVSEKMDTYDAKQLHSALYEVANQNAVSFRDLCQLIYGILIARKNGPKLAHFMLLIGKERVLQYFDAQRMCV